MNNLFLFFCTCFLYGSLLSFTIQAQHTISKYDTETAIAYCLHKTDITLKNMENSTQFPRFIKNNAYHWELYKTPGWTGGFWPGILWYAGEYDNNPVLKSAAKKFTLALEPILYNPVKSHDLGFLFHNSFGHAYRITGEEKYRDVLIIAADSLIKLFNPKVGTILSWPSKVRDKTFAPHNTIIDNMMNLELLFSATRETGDSTYFNIAVTHALTTRKNHIRKDSTTWHVIVYDDKTGEVLQKKTHQGYSDESLWARGQAWAIYGFSMCYRETGIEEFLDTAHALSLAYLKRLPADYIPYWDFNDPEIPHAPKDVSAAAIAASAFIELSGQSEDKELKQFYWNSALKILKSLTSEEYRAGNHNAAFLLHSTGNKPGNYEVDVPIIYADYYYLEALIRANDLIRKSDFNDNIIYAIPDIIHPRFLDSAIPSSGIEVQSNPPILRWPAINGQNVRYDIRLSKNEDFNIEKEYLEINDIPWAIANPHQKLETGVWHWQYRKRGSKWSEIMNFKVGENTTTIVSPTAEQFLHALSSSHPRVLATADELPLLRNMKMNDDIVSLFKEAEVSLKFIPPSETDGIPQKEGEDEKQRRKFQLDASKVLGTSVYNHTLILCQAYMLNGKEEYAEKAINVAMEVSNWDPKGISSLNDFGDARCMVTMALVYDTFHDRLSDIQKEKLLQSIQHRAEHFYSEWINQVESKVLSGHVWQHILHYFFQTALVVYNELPAAESWMKYAYELFLARTPVLGGFDGGWVEGVSYFKMNMETVLDIPLIIKKFTGFDFINSHPWYRENTKWMIYHIPPGSASDGFGDNSEEVLSPGKEYIGYATELAKLTGCPLATWYAKESRKYEKSNITESKSFRWTRITKTRDIPIPESSKISLPMGSVFKDIGVAALHSNITDTPNSLMVAFKSSPFGSYGHMLCDQNTFNILYGGEKVFYRTGYKVTMDDPHRTGWYRTTKSQNGILIDGEGQPYSNASFGFIPRFVQGEKLGYVKGDASNAYKEGNLANKGIKKVIRHVILLKPDIIIIYDELEAKREVKWSWLIHSLEKMEIDPTTNLFSVNLKNTKGQGKFFSAQDISWKLSDKFDVPAHNWRGSKNADGTLKDYSDPQFHLTLTNRDKTRSIYYLTVMQVSPFADLTNTLRTNKPDKNGKVDVMLDNWNIHASLNNNFPPHLEIREKDGNTVFNLYSDQTTIINDTIIPQKKGSTILIEFTDKEAKVQEVTDKQAYHLKQRILTREE